MVYYLDFIIITTYKILFKHLTKQRFSLNNFNYKKKKKKKKKQNCMWGEFDIPSNHTFLTPFSQNE